MRALRQRKHMYGRRHSQHYDDRDPYGEPGDRWTRLSGSLGRFLAKLLSISLYISLYSLFPYSNFKEFPKTPTQDAHLCPRGLFVCRRAAGDRVISAGEKISERSPIRQTKTAPSFDGAAVPLGNRWRSLDHEGVPPVEHVARRPGCTAAGYSPSRIHGLCKPPTSRNADPTFHGVMLATAHPPIRHRLVSS